ncbi:DUF2892 domain-containing protein [Alicyclobacillus sp. SP_1]|uniref:YgaP family membrane protein n=1 Tax=Alicyclobacillus sp. SP_1 TaxID=2942475 RepID=UPI00215811AF|nr:DUF2892 domain-containing protein [Alicyclobacillus sp. SP_1]
MEQNISTLSRYSRLVTGIVTVAAASSASRNRNMSLAMTSFGAMKMAEGILGWCPMMYVCNRLFGTEQSKGSASSQETRRNESQSATMHSSSQTTAASRQASPKDAPRRESSQSHQGSDDESSETETRAYTEHTLM